MQEELDRQRHTFAVKLNKLIAEGKRVVYIDESSFCANVTPQKVW